jgi:hypothetical protein
MPAWSWPLSSYIHLDSHFTASLKPVTMATKPDPAMSQVSQPSSPHMMYSDGPEVFQSYPEQLRPQNAPSYPATQPEEAPRIFGLRHQTFWLVLILLAVVIVAAVGGGVGGSIAVQNAK